MLPDEHATSECSINIQCNVLPVVSMGLAEFVVRYVTYLYVIVCLQRGAASKGSSG